MVFKAIGQAFDGRSARTAVSPASSWRAAASRSMASAAPRCPGVWAGGDCVAGGSDLTVVAVEDGKRVAARRSRRAHRGAGTGASPPAPAGEGVSNAGGSMADLRSRLRRHQVAEPVLAGLGAADRQGIQRRARLQGGLGRRGVEDARRGPAHRQRRRSALRRHPCRRPSPDRPQQHRADHRPRTAGQSRGDQAGQARLAGPRPRRLADGALRGAQLEGDPQGGRGDRLRRRRAQLRLPARHERARHGLGRRPGAGIHRDGRALVQGGNPHAGHRQADAQHHRHPLSRPRRQEGRRRRGLADQHHQLDHQRRSRHLFAGALHRRQGLPRRLLRPGGQADRAVDGLRDRPRPGDRRTCRSPASAASPPGATPPSSWRSAPPTCRSAPPP